MTRASPGGASRLTPSTDPAPERENQHEPRALTALLLGVFIAAYSTLCGIGGGVFAVPLLHFAWRFELRRAVASSLVLVAASTTTATIFEIVHAGSRLRFDVAGLLVAGSVIGARIGFAIGQRLELRTLKLFFCVLLVGVAAWIVFGGRPSTAFSGDAGSDRALTSAEIAWTAAIGLASGLVAPLFGIGGGLVAVPAQLALLPSLGFLVARACSTAMSTVTAWQSTWLHRREGALASPTALRLATGAVIGAVIGVQLVHLDGAARVARWFVVVVLLVSAARFAFDVLRASVSTNGARARSQSDRPAA